MFERYSAEAVRALFFARQAVSDHGGTEIKPAHLIIGVLHAHAEAVLRFASANVVADDMLQRLVAIVTEETRVPMAYEVGFSQDSKAALERAQIEADELSDLTIRPEHLILGVAVKTSGQLCRSHLAPPVESRATGARTAAIATQQGGPHPDPGRKHD